MPNGESRMTAVARCELLRNGQPCGYALMPDGTCPIHGGRQVSERLPMIAPLPEPRATDVWPITRRRKRRRSA